MRPVGGDEELDAQHPDGVEGDGHRGGEAQGLGGQCRRTLDPEEIDDAQHHHQRRPHQHRPLHRTHAGLQPRPVRAEIRCP